MEVAEHHEVVHLDIYGLQKPSWRGAVHAWAAGPMALAGLLLTIFAPSTQARIAVSIYAVAVSGMLTASAVYHRVHVSPEVRVWLRRLDHSMIGVTVAGSYTPVVVLLTEGVMRVTLLILLWSGATASLLISFLWPSAPRLLRAGIYIGLGWAGVAVMPQLLTKGGTAAFIFVVLSALLYTIGAVVYARRKPDPWPSTFGFHEVFHTLVASAVISHFVALVLVVHK